MSFFFSKLNARERPVDPLARLRNALESIPTSRKYHFSAATRSEVLSELYDAFWGPHAHLFLPSSRSSVLPMQSLLSEVQIRSGFGGNGRDRDPIVPGRVCGRVFQKGESCYRCKDCALDESCVMCSRCFLATDHTGHNISLYLSQQPGGCCDCGDAEAWRHPIGCPHHPLGDITSLPAKATAQTLENWIPKVYNPHRYEISPDLKKTMSQTIGYAIDFILDTLDYSPDEAIAPRNEAELRAQPSADPNGLEMYAVAVWNDEKHSFEDVAQIISDTAGVPREQAIKMSDVIDDQGRDVIDIGTNVRDLLEVSTLVSQIDLGVTVRRVHDYVREQVAAVVIEWLLDLTQCRLMTDTIVIRETIGAELFARRKEPPASTMEANRIGSEIKDPARMDWLFLYHTRLWKKPRLSLKQVYLSVLTLSHEHKLAVATHFANVYHRIIDSYLLVDREPENSIKYFALRLFTVPSIAQHIVRHHSVVSRLLDIITAFFTNQIDQKRVIFPATATGRGLIDVETFPFKSKRFMPVFSDLRFICSNESVQTLIAKNLEFTKSFAKVCQLFVGINPNKRAASAHVEYETEAWISVFNVTVSLSRVIKVYGEAFAKGTTADVLAAIGDVMHSILMVCTLVEDRLDKTKYSQIDFHEVTFNGKTYQVIEFDVLSNWVSFHHSLHWLLAEFLKHADLLSPASLVPITKGDGSLRTLMIKHFGFGERAVLTVLEFPLRVIVMIAQIRSGLWVRNGFAVRGQLLHYRDFMLRELCYDQDLFMLQATFAILDPELVLITLLDRFQLLGWFSGIEGHATYDAAQLYSMVEEFLFVMITCVNETGNTQKTPFRDSIRREVIHVLASGPSVFTEIIKRLAERMVDDVCFEGVLAEVAHFKPPETTVDSGLYELKDELYEEVDPFFHHFNRNKREEVDSILRNRIKKKTGDSDPVVVPKPLGITSGPYQCLPDILLTETTLRILYHSIANVIRDTEAKGSIPASADAILDQALHLIMLSLVEHSHRFAEIGCQHICYETQTLLDVICAFEDHEKFKGFRARASWILDRFAASHPSAVNAVRRGTRHTGKLKTREDDKKRAAKARQAAIMKNFAAAQQSFLNNLDAEDDEEDVTMDDPAQQTHGTCIVCQENLDDHKAFGSLALIQPSRFVRLYPDSNWDALHHVLCTPESLDRKLVDPLPANSKYNSVSPPVPTAILADKTVFGMHMSVCGHMMHLECFAIYSTSIRQRHRAQAQRNHPESITRKEYICPLCKSLGNCFLPVVEPLQLHSPSQSFVEWVRGNGIELLRSSPDRQVEFQQYKYGLGNFAFWAAQDSGYQGFPRGVEGIDTDDHHRMVDTIIGVSKSISLQTRHLRGRGEPDPGERGAGAYLPEDLVAYTLSCLEISQRGFGSPVAHLYEAVPEHSLRMIRGLLSTLAKLSALQFKVRADHGRDGIRKGLIKRLLPEWKREPANTEPLLWREQLPLLVEIAAIAPEMLPHAVVLLYYANLARVTIGVIASLNRSQTAVDPSIPTLPEPRPLIEGLFGDIRTFITSTARNSELLDMCAQTALQAFSVERLEGLIYAFSLPFLRRASILLHAVVPGSLNKSNEDGSCEYLRLLHLMGIPPPAKLPLYETLQNLLSGWCSHLGIYHNRDHQRSILPLEYPNIYRFAQLPSILDTLFNSESSQLVCHRCNTSPTDAGICLLCGKTVCIQSHCCREVDYRERGECNMHTRECGGVVGLYFSLKRCAVIYLYANNGAFQQAPYLDVHGETDLCLRRGRRQYLHPLRLEEIRKIWLNHGIPTFVARKLEGSVDSGGWESL